MTLSQHAATNPSAAEILADTRLSNAEAADRISADGFRTSASSVKRYRDKQRAPTLEELADPNGSQRPLFRKTNGIPQWSSGVEVDVVEGIGVIRTVPLPVSEPIDPEDERILLQHNLDPGKWVIVSYRESTWDVPGFAEPMHAYRVSVRKRVSDSSADIAELERFLSSYGHTPPKKRRKGKGVLAVPLSDFQAGKPEGGGSAAIVDRFAKLTEQVRQRIESEFGGKLAALVVPIMGDLVEGCTAAGGKLGNDVGVSVQLRVVRRMLIHFFRTLAPLADRVLVVVAPGNHGEVRRDREAKATDNWDLEAVVGVMDVLEAHGGFEHVSVVYPPTEDSLSAAVDIDGQVLGATHGHVLSGGQNGVSRWLADQALGMQPVGQSRWLFLGHFHTLRIEDMSGRIAIQVPSIDGGSSWFTNKKGSQSVVGMVSVELLPHEAPYWRGLVLHTAE